MCSIRNSSPKFKSFRFGNQTRDDRMPPTTAELRAAERRWVRRYGLTPGVLLMYLGRVKRNLFRTYGRVFSDDLVLALLLRMEKHDQAGFIEAIDYATRVARDGGMIP